MQTLTLHAARVAQAAQPQLATPGISPQTINAVMGKIPIRRERIPFWIALKTSQLEAVFSIQDPMKNTEFLQ